MFTYKSILTAVFFSFFIYLEHFGVNSTFINTVLALMAVSSLFMLKKQELFVAGFLISILWFWWIGYSFIYYELSYLIPIVIIAISVIYGLLFYLIGIFNNLFYKIISIFALSFVNPFGFNWFKIELPFINSYFGTSKIEFLIILVSLAFFIKYKNKYQKESILLLFTTFCILYIYNSNNVMSIKAPNIKIFQAETNINQKDKWKKNYRQKIINDNLTSISKAVKNDYDLIILPETAFPLLLNRNNHVNEKLLKLSFDISIVLGSLYEKDGLYYNSTYFYDKGNLKIAHKVVLVPFGEAVPMPEKIRNFINNIFYKGAKDYETAKAATTFTIKNIKFRSAICYEITRDEIYKDLDTPYIIAISNNAWFTPSIEPTLQKLLMQYYAQKYKVYYFHATNK
ncbi:MAG: apolipoprotein N-acyltransferase [Arcobacteraceae bacterium]|jgi:apolipoprotein N-acyltransferase